MTQDLKTPHPKTNGPSAAGKRFVGQVMEFTLREGWRTPDDFLRFFSAEAIMEALKGAPELRVSILSAATGMHEQILQRKSMRFAAEDLRLALEVGTTSGLQLLDAFPAVERIRYLDIQRLWDFLVEDQFWLLGGDASSELRRSAATRMTFTLSTAFREKLITLRDVLDGLTYDAVADSLSPEELRRVVRYALVKGRDNVGLNDKTLLEVLPLDKLIACVPLEHTWNEVIVKRLALPNNLTDLRREERRTSQIARASRPAVAVREPARRPSQRPAAGAPSYSPAPAAAFAAPGGFAAPQAAPVSYVAASVPAGLDVAPGSLRPPPPLNADADAQQRQRVTEHLRSIARLPLTHERLPLAVLRSIDAMYALLPSANDDLQRKSVIRAAFSGDHHLRMALLGLIELMDSSVDTSDPVIQEAKIDALIKILVFEEQRRKETGRVSVPASHGSMGQTMMGIGGPGSQRYSSALQPPPASYPPSPGSYPPPPALQRPPLSSGYRESPPPSATDPAGGRRTVPPPLPPSFLGNGGGNPGPGRGLS